MCIHMYVFGISVWFVERFVSRDLASLASVGSEFHLSLETHICFSKWETMLSNHMETNVEWPV